MQNDPNLRVEASAVRSKKFKFIKNKEAVALFDLKNDISEKNNLKNQETDVYNNLVNEHKKWLKTLKDPIFLGLMANKQYNKLNPDRFKY